MAAKKQKPPAKRKASTKASRSRRSDRKPDDSRQKLCCCPPRALVWIDKRTDCCFIENRIDMQRRLRVHADAHASMRPPAGPDADSESVGGSQLDEGTSKPQGKVYRTDVYTVHWKALGDCRPLGVELEVRGAVEYRAMCLPEEGEVTLSASAMLEPPDYGPASGPVTAVVTVSDCLGHVVSCANDAPKQT